jgi:N6-L-threonylcarbamoyladenine synthase
MLTLGIETSCDETSVALLKDNQIIANEVFTQDAHSLYGGVVPEIASRAHLDKIEIITNNIFSKNNLKINDINNIAVTDSPGLAGALLVGISFALGLHCKFNIPITGINHIEGHIFSILLAYPQIKFPFLSCVVSGGHTAIYLVKKIGDYLCMGKTVDDAAGEAFDKVGKLLGFSYPAGRLIEEKAKQATNKTKIEFPIAKCSGSNLNFSFSGLKTAVKNFCKEKGEEWVNENKSEICFAFQKAVIDSLLRNILIASKETGINTITVVGGVACNFELKNVIKTNFGENAFFPPPYLCTDNAAMIARAGYERFKFDITRFPSMSPTRDL